MTEDAMAYLARQPCGCVAAVAIESPDHRRVVARAIAGWILRGWTVERLPVAVVRVLAFTCPAHPVAQRERAEQGVMGL